MAHFSNTIIDILPSGSLQGPFLQYIYLYPYSHLAAYRAHFSNTFIYTHTPIWQLTGPISPIHLFIPILPSGSLQGPFLQYIYLYPYSHLAAYRAHFAYTIIAILPSGSLHGPFLQYNYSHTPIWQLTGSISPIQL